MAREFPYLLRIQRWDPDLNGGLGAYTHVTQNRIQYGVEIVLTDTDDLDDPTDFIEVTYTAGEGDSMPGSRGWKEHLTGFGEAATRKMTFDLAQLPTALAEGLVKPSLANGGSISYGSGGGAYFRIYPTQNAVIIWSDRDQTAGELKTIEGIYVQRPALTNDFTAHVGGGLVMVIELMDAGAWVLQQMRAADVAGYVFGELTGTGPYRWLIQDAWEAVSGNRYVVRIGQDPSLSNYQEFTLHTQRDVYIAMATIATDMLQDVLRRRTPAVTLALTFGDSAGPANTHTRHHWSFFPHTHTPAWARGTTPVTYDVPLVVTKMALHSDPDIVIGGFLHIPAEGDEAFESTLAAWKSVWDFLVDESIAAVTKVASVAQYNAVANAITYYMMFERVKDALFIPAAPELALEVFDNNEITGSIGAGVIARATAAVPGAISEDASPVTLEGTFGVEGDDAWNCPRGFHTLPSPWRDGERFYGVPDDPDDLAEIYMRVANFLCLYHLSDANGILDGAEPVRLHHDCDMSDGVTTYSNDMPSIVLPTPAIDTDWRDDAEAGDEAFGNEYLACVAIAQRNAGAPLLAAKVMNALFGNPQMTTYSGTVPITNAPYEQLGNVVPSADWPNGNVLLPDGATYFGDLPGSPIVQFIDDDLLGKQQAKVTLLAIPEAE